MYRPDRILPAVHWPVDHRSDHRPDWSVTHGSGGGFQPGPLGNIFLVRMMTVYILFSMCCCPADNRQTIALIGPSMRGTVSLLCPRPERSARASSVWIVRLSVRPFVRNSVPLI